MTEPNTKYSEGLVRAEAFFNQVFPSLEFKSNVEKHSEAQGEETNGQKKPGKEKCKISIKLLIIIFMIWF